jgi:hypothetical protein
MTDFISGCQGTAGIEKMTVMNAMGTMPSTPPAGDHGRRPRPTTDLQRFNLGTSDVNGCEIEDGDDEDADEEEEASQSDNRSTQNVVD